ncbi:RNA-directed DNA polymerase [Vibrio sp. S17_S38]|uniref:RNA-directed DNA polymerase n=1 Tax=Vibrio sp. S17_S38 TaxID=2720229 RepID=UPI001EED505F|nr:RNA-directed DNA polymerase [Vibrio sp. S17_S38]
MSKLSSQSNQSPIAPILPSQSDRKNHRAGCHEATKRTNWKHLINQIPLHKKLQFNNTQQVGLPIGSVTSQLFGNFHLNNLDHEIKHTLKVKGYVRYIDDLFILSNSLEKMQEWKERLRYFNAILDSTTNVVIKYRPSCGGWSKHGIHYAPLYTQLKAMQSTINSCQHQLKSDPLF